MTILSEFLTGLNNRISAAEVSGFWTPEMKKEWINTAGERVCNFKRWQCLEYALKTVTKADGEYYDYPEDFQENSIFMLSIGEDTDEYILKSWDDYQAYRQAGSSEKIFANHNGYYFINPTPTGNSLVLSVWGIRKWEKLVGDTDETITPREMDEAIIKLALATCLQKERRYGEASAEIAEVELPANPRIENSGGILARLSARSEDEGTKGHIGRAKLSRWL